MTSSAGTCVDLRAPMVLSSRPDTRGSATLLQFRGGGQKLALTAVRGLRRFKGQLQAVAYTGNRFGDGLTSRFAFESALIETLLCDRSIL
jgi:hypothetical protein